MSVRWVSVGLLCAAFTSTGCSGGIEADPSRGSTGDDFGSTGGELDPQPGTGVLDETGSLDESGSEGEDTAPPACELDCGEGGFCEYDDDDAPTCTCVEGYAAYGLRCLPCAPTTGELQLDIPRVQVVPHLWLNGEPFPASLYEHGDIVLRDPATGDEIELASTRRDPPLDPVPVLPGNYEVHYQRRNGGQLVPANRSVRLSTVSIPAAGPFDLEVDVAATELSGRFTLAGAPPPSGLYENGAVVLRNRATGDEVPLGDTRDGDYRQVVVPGTYDVHYRRRLAETVAPRNRNARVGVVVVEPPGDTGEQQLDIDIGVTTLTGDITLDGAPPPRGLYENGRLILRDLATGDETELGHTAEGSFALPVASGEYEVIYRRLIGELVPINRAAVVQTVALQPGAQQLDVDIPTGIVTGSITIDGAVPPSDPDNDGVIVLRNAATGDEAVLGSTADGSYDQRVVLGRYDVYYRQQSSSGGVPVNTNARLLTVELRGGAVLDVNVPMVTLGATVTVDGQLPPDDAYDDGLLYLRDLETGDSVLLGNTRQADLSRPVVPGTYELHYVVEAAGAVMPINAQSRLDVIEVGPGTQLDVDIPVVELQAQVTLAGAAPPMALYERAELRLHDTSTDDVVYLGPIETGELHQSLTTGTYVLAYHAIISNGLTPVNSNAGLACIELVNP